MTLGGAPRQLESPFQGRPDALEIVRGARLGPDLVADRGVLLDLGATAKALAADRAAARAAGVTGGGVLVSLGGDLAAFGDPPAGGWTVSISDDHREAIGRGEVIGIAGGGLATSSTTVRRWHTASGVTVHHIVADGWSLKKLHKLIMLSSVYQQGSQPSPTAAKLDPENRLLAHQNRRRLDFEFHSTSTISTA
jgi:thiamine biosynthesis lipoprotein ApbE